MKVIYGDFETYYDNKSFTLRSMTIPEYINDPRFEVTICSVCDNTNHPECYEGDDCVSYFNALPRPWTFVSYNALFDAAILSYKYNIYPDVLIDTMGIVRATILHRISTGRIDLKTVSEFMDLPSKGDVIKYVSGMRLDDIKRNGYFDQYVNYNLRDVYNLRTVTQKLAPKFSRREISIMDMILKMATIPSFYGDVVKLVDHFNIIQNEKDQLLQRVGLERGQLLSNDKFVESLEALGVAPPVKISPTTGKYTWATAKSDYQMQELENHPNPDVQALWAARVGVKSTQEETRTQRFINVCDSFQTSHGKPFLPVALKYSGAHTHRFSGEWKMNMQNLPGRKTKKLREAVIAPPGHTIVAVDASQIEARLTAWIAGEEKLLHQFRNHEDVYSNFASILYQRPITRENELERFTGKTCILGLGFQMGDQKLLNTARQQAKDNGYSIEYTIEDCSLYVFTFRNEFRMIKRTWWKLGEIIRDMYCKNIRADTMIGPCEVFNECIVLPGGLRLNYYNLQEFGGQYTYQYGRMYKKIYGGKLLENVVQALDREHVMDAALRILKQTGIRPCHNVHDELLYVVPDNYVDTLQSIALEEMRTPAWWGKDLPLDAEVKIGRSYGELKKV